MTTKEKFEKWFKNESISREGTISEAIRVKVLKEEKPLSENAYTAGHKEGKSEGSKDELEQMKSRLEIKGANEWLGWEFLDYIDTELKKVESNEN